MSDSSNNITLQSLLYVCEQERENIHVLLKELDGDDADPEPILRRILESCRALSSALTRVSSMVDELPEPVTGKRRKNEPPPPVSNDFYLALDVFNNQFMRDLRASREAETTPETEL